MIIGIMMLVMRKDIPWAMPYWALIEILLEAAAFSVLNGLMAGGV